ncbi:hypothetical protein E2C01_034861 [Portunus trituberculatus]|uniref:Uncharacterized protein n=1 Tax=Portunus trituberculatus TaxID=210409 RepID=A0A5B7F854_PORTR|nr:hypothetical protein [Portunus trituberculatus]
MVSVVRQKPKLVVNIEFSRIEIFAKGECQNVPHIKSYIVKEIVIDGLCYSEEKIKVSVELSSPIFEAFVTKVSVVEAEFHRRISEVREEFRGLSCRVNSAPERVAVPAVSLPSNETQGQEKWRVVSGGGKRRKVIRALHRVETTNSFVVLEGVEEEGEKAGGDEMRRADDSLSAGKILIVGNSQVRHVDSAFCAKDKERRKRVCRAEIDKVSAQLNTCFEADGTKLIIFLGTGGNDLCKVRSEQLFRRFKEAFFFIPCGLFTGIYELKGILFRVPPILKPTR